MAGRMRSKISPDGKQPEPEEILDDNIRDELKRFFLRVVREADKEYRQSVPCEKCPGFKHQVNFVVPDIQARIKAAEQLLDRLEGRPAAQKAAEAPPKYEGARLEDMTDDELAAMAAQSAE